MAGGERDITLLLEELGLQRYAATFEDEDFTDPALLLSMRHQRKLNPVAVAACLAAEAVVVVVEHGGFCRARPPVFA